MSDLPMDVAAPNWAEISTEPQCPLCEYMLRGLNVAQCPECGFKFEWSEVLDASKWDHPYLFEHHPRRNGWSFFKTMMGAMLPRQFWSELHPSQYDSRRRLIIYWFVGLVICAASFFLSLALSDMVTETYEKYIGPHASAYRGNRSISLIAGDSILRAVSYRNRIHAFRYVLGVIGLWPWITYLALKVFSDSMKKAKVKPIHVLRCAIYSIDVLLPILIFLFVALVSITIDIANNYYNPRISGELIESTVLGLLVVVFCFQTYRLGAACKYYLRLDHAYGVAISAQIISILFALIHSAPV